MTVNHPTTKLFHPFTKLLVMLLFASGCAAPHLRAVQGIGSSPLQSFAAAAESLKANQQATKSQFIAALEKLRSLVEVPGADLTRRFNEMSAEFEVSGDRAREYRDSIVAFEESGQIFFDAWENELKEPAEGEKKFGTAQELTLVKGKFGSIVQAANKASTRIDPILLVFNEQLQFLKNNVNAQSVAALKNRYSGVASNTRLLTAELDQAIANSESFLRLPIFTPLASAVHGKD